MEEQTEYGARTIKNANNSLSCHYNYIYTENEVLFGILCFSCIQHCIKRGRKRNSKMANSTIAFFMLDKNFFQFIMLWLFLEIPSSIEVWFRLWSHKIKTWKNILYGFQRRFSFYFVCNNFYFQTKKKEVRKHPTLFEKFSIIRLQTEIVLFHFIFFCGNKSWKCRK